MSGNPFRRRPAEEPPHGNDETTPASTKKLMKKKKVTIQTPPHSPEEPRRLSAGRISPPPPAQNPNDDDSDSTATADSDTDQADLNTRQNSGSLPPPNAGTSSNTGAPSNPFARTLASSEAAFGLSRVDDGAKDASGSKEDADSQPRRPVMNVDQFKNILMTGSPAPTPPVSTPGARVQDSSSSTDTSSVSRQSLFDPMLGVYPESPRTSFDDIESDLEDEGNDNSNLVSGTSRLDDLAPPAPPKSIYGKTTGIRGPQTVSFADFDESIPSPPTPAEDISPTGLTERRGMKKPSALTRSSSDLNKPLPKTPPLSPAFFRYAEDNGSDPIQPFSDPTIPAVTTTEPSPQQKKAPPPPPASRRTAPTSGSEGRARSSSNPIDETSQEGAAVSSSSPQPKSAETTTKAAAPPPPPPSRKARPVSQIATPTTETLRGIPSPSPLAADAKTMPPPPPRRNPSKTGDATNRSPSTASRSSASHIDPPVATATNAPPAPPPRRGVKSNRDSTDVPPSSMNWAWNNRRFSGNSFESERSTFLSNLQHVADGGEARSDVTSTTTESSRDVLADMSAFQAEIDALRAQRGTGD